MRVVVAAYALSAVSLPAGLAVAAAYLVFAIGNFWVSTEERDRLEIAALAADGAVAALSVWSDNYILVLLCFGLMAAHGVIVTVLKRRLERLAYHINRKSVLYRAEAIQARGAERERLAADFHDGPMQIFMSYQMRLEVLRRLLERDPEAARAELVEFQEMVAGQVGEIRQFMHRARDTGADLEETDLIEACQELARIFERDTGIAVEFEGSGDSSGVDDKRTLEVLHMVREALHNVYKHAGATRIGAAMRVNGGIEIDVRDNGKGFPFRGAYKLEELELMKLGPEAIKRRVRDLGGSLTLESRPGEGSRLVARIPQ